MYARLNARNQIVEATDAEQGSDYVLIDGSVESNMPDGLLGFNGSVYTPNYEVIDGSAVPRSQEDKARDPFSDEPEPPEDYETAYNIVTGVTE